MAVLTLVIGVYNVRAGNKDRQGQAGAGHLLINPWARSTGLNGLNTANIEGVESMRLNVAGLSSIGKTEAIFSQNIYFQGAGISISTFGIGQKVGAAGALGLSIMSMNMGDIEVTTNDNPDGGLGTFSPSYTNIGISYSKLFSNSISGGFTFRIVSESITDASALGVALDGGFQYVTGPKENIHFGLSIRNVGTPMTYRGAGLTFRGEPDLDPDKSYQQTLVQPTNSFELPSLLNIGLAYDMIKDSSNHRFTLVANFTSNAFGRDHLGLGGEFALKEKFMFRVGYKYEEGIFNKSERTTIMTGLAGGITFQLPIGESNLLALDYSYRTTFPYNGIHNIGLRFNIQ